MWRRAVVAVAAGAVLATAGCSGSTGDGGGSGGGSGELSPEIQALYKAALEEGEVTYWGSDDPPVVEQIMAQFNATFPGITVNPVQIQPEEAVEKVISASESGQAAPTDVLASTLIPAKPLMDRDLAETIDWASLGVPDGQTFYDDRGVLVFNLTYSIAFNPDKISKNDVPDTVQGLIDDPDLNDGKLVLESRGRLLAVGAQDTGVDQTLADIDALLDKDPLVIKGAAPLAQAVSTGEAYVGLALLTSSALEVQAQGANIDYVVPDPLPVTSLTNIVVKDAPHPNAAKLLAWWQNTPEAMDAYQAAGLFPERFTGDWIPDYSQAMIDSGTTLLYENEDKIDLMVQAGAAISQKLAGLVP